MRRSPGKEVPRPRRRGEASAVPERVFLGVRVTPEQKAFLSRLGDGSISVGFDRAVSAALSSGAPR